MAAEEERTYSATEHLALLNDAVARETASLTSAKEELTGSMDSLTAEKAALETVKAELENKLDVAVAEKEAAEKARDEAIQAHETYVAELTELAAAGERRAARTEAASAAGLSDDYIAKRIDRWMGLTEEAFADHLTDLSEVVEASAAKHKDSNGDGKCDACGSAMDGENAACKGTQKADTEGASTETARETSAFAGGAEIKTPTGATLRGLMAARGRVPAQH